jgi:protein involved in polysaccharide export with SLBB domain
MVTALTLLLVIASTLHAETRVRRGEAAETAPNPRGATQPATEDGLERPEHILIPRGLDRPVDPDTYVLGPSDQLILIVRGSEQRELELTVLPEGTLILPNRGPIMVAGMTITEFRNQAKRDLDKYYPGVELHVQLVVPRSFITYVLGDVSTPGPVQMNPPFRLDRAIEASGGVIDRGSKRTIEIRNDDGTVDTVDLERFYRLGEMEHNPVLHEGQIVFVPTRTPTYSIIGEIWHGGILEAVPGETIADAVEMAGGFTAFAAMEQITLERMSADEVLSVTRVDSADFDTALVQGRDIIVVSDVRTFPGTGSVLVQGGRGREGRILISEGETLGMFITRFIRLRDDHDLANAVVERDRDDGTVEFIPVDLTLVIEKQGDVDLVLEPGDVISIPLRDDLVYVTGEVTLPGPIDFQRGLPASRYIALAGGQTSRGSIDRLEIFDTEGNRRSGNRDALVYRGETILVRRNKSSVFGTLFVGFTSLASLILATIALSRTN